MNEDSIRIFAAAAFIASIPIMGMIYLQISKINAHRRTKKIADGGADFVAKDWAGRPQFAEAPPAPSFVENYIDPQARASATQGSVNDRRLQGHAAESESSNASSEDEVSSVFGGALHPNSISDFPAAPNVVRDAGR